MTLALENMNRRMLRARHAMDRTYALPLDIKSPEVRERRIGKTVEQLREGRA
jgi:hypothetical protein